MTPSLPPSSFESDVRHICGHALILDTDLAVLYGVTAKRLNEQVKRNAPCLRHDGWKLLALRDIPKKRIEKWIADDEVVYQVFFGGCRFLGNSWTRGRLRCPRQTL